MEIIHYLRSILPGQGRGADRERNFTRPKAQGLVRGPTTGQFGFDQRRADCAASRNIESKSAREENQPAARGAELLTEMESAFVEWYRQQRDVYDSRIIWLR
jgi:hypothetical protein